MADAGDPAALRQNTAVPGGEWKPLTGFGMAIYAISFAALVIATAGLIPAFRATEAPAGPGALGYSPAAGFAGSAFAQAAGMDWGAGLAGSPLPTAPTSAPAAESAPAAAGAELSVITVSPVTVASSWSMGPLPERPAFVHDASATPVGGTEASAVELLPLRMTSSVVAGPQAE